MQNQNDCVVVPPAPKAVRGFSSSIDVSDQFILTFNANSVIFRPHQHPHKSLVLNHVSDVAAARFSHDGRLAASIDMRGTLIISEPVADRVIQVYQYENVFPNAKYLDWSADKKKVCVVGEGKTKFAKVISIDMGTTGDIGTVSATLNSCSFRPERPYKLVMGGDELELKCYEGPPYNFVKSDKSHSGFINHIRYSPKGTYIVSGGADRKLVLYDGKTYERLGEKENAHNGSIFGLDWVDDEHFVTVSSDKLIKFWNTKFEEKQFIEGAFAEDMKNNKNFGLFLVGVKAFKDRVYVCNIDGDVIIYSNPLGGKKAELLHTYPGSRSKIVKLSQFAHENLILFDMGGRVLSCNLSSHEVSVCAPEIQMNCILDGFVSNDRIYAMTNNGAVWMYEGPSTKQLKLVKTSDKVEFQHICRSQNPEHISGITNNKLITYDVQFDKVIKEVAVNEDVTFLASKDQFTLVGTLKGKVLLYNQQFQLVESYTLNTFKITNISIFGTHKPNVYRCLLGDACGKMGMIQISEHGVKAVKQTMGGHNSVITGAACDDKKLYTFSMDGKICIWNNDNLIRESDIKDSVNGGILGGLCIGGYLAVTGNDMVTKLFGKGK